jgi:hypothetical protein
MFEDRRFCMWFLTYTAWFLSAVSWCYAWFLRGDFLWSKKMPHLENIFGGVKAKLPDAVRCGKDFGLRG